MALAAASNAFGRLGNHPEYPMLEKAELVALFEGGSLKATDADRMAVRCEITKPRIVRGETGTPLVYVSEEVRLPEKTRTHLVFLARGEKGWTPVNWMGSTISATTEVSALTSDGDQWQDIVRTMFHLEEDADCALRQARIIITGPREFAKTCVRPLEAEDRRLWLARFVVALYGNGEDALKETSGDLARIGTSCDQVDAWSESMRASISSWVGKFANSENSSQILDFTLRQSGRLQADLMIGVARWIPSNRIGDVAKLLRTSRHNVVRYGCYKALSHQLNGGKEICGVDDFGRNPARYIRRAESWLAENGGEKSR